MSRNELSEDMMLYYPYWLDQAQAGSIMLRCDGARLSAAQVLSRWGADGGDFDSIPCLNVPLAICELIVREEWKELVCLARWESWYSTAQLPRPFGDWPDPVWMAEWPTDEDPGPTREIPSTTAVTEVHDLVCQAAQAFLGDDGEAGLDLLSTVATRLRLWEVTLSEEAGERVTFASI